MGLQLLEIHVPARADLEEGLLVLAVEDDGSVRHVATVTVGPFPDVELVCVRLARALIRELGPSMH